MQRDGARSDHQPLCVGAHRAPFRSAGPLARNRTLVLFCRRCAREPPPARPSWTSRSLSRAPTVSRRSRSARWPTRWACRRAGSSRTSARRRSCSSRCCARRATASSPTSCPPALREPRGEPRLRALLERWLVWTQSSFLPGGCPSSPPPPSSTTARSCQGLPRQSQRDWLDALAQAARIAVAEGHLAPDLDEEQLVFELYGAALGFPPVSIVSSEIRRRSTAAAGRSTR
jgi:hypothetical protein